LAAHLEEVGQSADWGHALTQRTGLEKQADAFRRVAVVANQSFQYVATAGHGGLLAAQLVGLDAQRIFLGAAGLQSLAQSRDLGFQPLEGLSRGLEALPGLTALRAQVFLLVARLV